MFASANPYLRFGLDSDPVAIAALVASILALLLSCSKRGVAHLERLGGAKCALALALGAAGLSAGYVAYYLRGGPRIIDAAYYYLEGRAFAEGSLSFPVPSPSASFHGRFLLSNPDTGRVGVLFPPGYPAALALAFLLRAPLLLGPLLALLLVLATYRLARELGAARTGACVAAGLSLVSAALRYHTADTMSHGLAALLVVGSTLAALRPSKASALVAGLGVGWLIATRPVTGVVVGVALVAFTALVRRAPVRIALLAAGALPGVALLLAYQHAVTGDWFHSTQLAYYAVADGPPGCFRYGFGANIGCLFEHGDYVRARLPAGYGLAQALATTWRRLLVHSLDIANFAPLALGVPFAAWLGRREASTRLLSLIVLGVVLGYAPFYFEGSFPGGGARFFADLLPLEHVLLARALCTLGAARFAWPLALAGFALHTSTQHRALRDREGGHPMFEASVLAAHGVARGLVFVSTDHGFALGHQPGQLSATTGVVVAHERHDALDGELWEGLGRPPSYRYVYEPSKADAVPRLVAWSPSPKTPGRIEAESLWPPESVKGGWVEPVYRGEACTSAGRALHLHADSGRLTFSLALPRASPPHFVRLGSVLFPPEMVVFWADQATGQQRAPVRWIPGSEGCWQSEPIGPMRITGGSGLGFEGGSGVLDFIELLP
jgi:hypothetical protein